MIELEKTYLIKYLPDLSASPNKEIIDIYFPKNLKHPILRLRKNGNKYEITRKTMIHNDPSKQEEYTIPLIEEKFLELSQIDGKKVSKIRYNYDFNGKIAEIDIFQGELNGLVVVDFEFNTEIEKDNLLMPKFCLTDVTTEEFIAGGILCGKKYSDIEKELEQFGYKKFNFL